jgi:hypothetical protein
MSARAFRVCVIVHVCSVGARARGKKKMFGIFGMQMLCNSLEARAYVCA